MQRSVLRVAVARIHILQEGEKGRGETQSMNKTVYPLQQAAGLIRLRKMKRQVLTMHSVISHCITLQFTKRGVVAWWWHATVVSECELRTHRSPGAVV